MIRTTDRESVRYQGVGLQREAGKIRFACRRCPFTRLYATEAGAYEGASLHMLHVHRVRLFLPRSAAAQ